MRKQARVTAIRPRSSLWANHAADAMFAYLCGDSSGNDLSEVNGAADSGDYTGTTTNLWDEPVYGVQPAGDGTWSLPAAANAVFQMQQPCRIVVACQVTLDALNLAAAETLFSIGYDNETAGNLPGEGHFRLDLLDTGVDKIRPRIAYRNAGTDAAAPAQQPTNPTSDDGNIQGSDETSNIAIVLSSDGETVGYQFYVDGAAVHSGTFTANGTGPINVDRGNASALIGGKLIADGNVRASGRAGESTSGVRMRGLVLWRKNGATEADALALVNDLNAFPAEASRYL